uniref:Uncharacterized protein n=3 Tax=Oryza TaxID=4527 RepID=A0A0D3FXD3_9ORYZ
MAPIASRGSGGISRCYTAATTAATMASGGVRLRRRGFVLCAVDHHGVRRAVVGGQFVRKSELRRQDELLVSLHELVGVFRELQRKLGFRQWDEFRRAQPELDVLYSRLRFQGKRYRSRIYGEPMPDFDDAVHAAVRAPRIGDRRVCSRCSSCDCWYSDLANLHCLVRKFV